MERYTLARLPGEVPNTHWSNGSDTLLVLLPGLGYTNEMPIMFYIHQLAITHGWDVLQVDYNYRDVPREQWASLFVNDSRPIIETALAAGSYRNVILAGKSIGTRVMTALLNDGFDAATAYVWITPLFAVPEIREAAFSHAPSVALWGTADDTLGDTSDSSLASADVASIAVPNADHSLQLSKDVVGSIEALAIAIRQVDAWLTEVILTNVQSTGDLAE